MLTSILIANRGEIACRIARTARRMGLRVIAVYSDADADAPFVRMADEAYRIGPAPARESYLVAARILDVARQSGAASIHPGYGFLSENAEFAEACAAAGITFIGPSAAAIRAMGLKDRAKAFVEKAGVRVVPGYHGDAQEAEFLACEAEKIGYPVLIKAVAGGGGKGMRRVDAAADFTEALASAQREGANSFGDPRVLIEKYINAPRHVEVQVFGDSHGNVIHLFERDCSMQRRHQKVIEEAPAPGMDAATRAAFGAAAVAVAKAVNYVGAGTVEFIADGAQGLKADGFYFMEMNTRLQVEHPVTEAITGLDLVEWQIRVASGEALPLRQEQITLTGHAVEARLYAEEPERGFLPSTGTLYALRLPEGEGIRVDSGVEEGGAVTPYYDPMIAKIIAHAPTRDAALDRLRDALADTIVAGPKTNARFLQSLIDQPDFRAGRLDTGLIARNLEALGAAAVPRDAGAIAAGALALMAEEKARLFTLAESRSRWADDPWNMADGFALAPGRVSHMAVMAEGVKETLTLDAAGESALDMDGDGQDYTLVAAEDAIFVLDRGRQTRVAPFDPLDVVLDGLAGAADGIITAPMHGKIIALHVSPGAQVTKGTRLAVLEAMKMEHPVLAPCDGMVEGLTLTAGAQVAQGARLMRIVAAEA